jgi:molecular chaperone GrpE
MTSKEPSSKKPDGNGAQPANEPRASDPPREASSQSQANETQPAAELPASELPDDELRRQLAEANDRTLRAQAELENFRKRVRREMEDERRYAALSVIRDLLGVLDNLERAVEAAEKSETKGGTSAGLLDGVKMVVQQFSAVLAQHHCRRIEAVGQPFDPNLHEAVGQEPTEQYPPGTVVRELRSGYLLHDRVLRPSQVLISTFPPN